MGDVDEGGGLPGCSTRGMGSAVPSHPSLIHRTSACAEPVARCPQHECTCARSKPITPPAHSMCASVRAAGPPRQPPHTFGRLGAPRSSTSGLSSKNSPALGFLDCRCGGVVGAAPSLSSTSAACFLDLALWMVRGVRVCAGATCAPGCDPHSERA